LEANKKISENTVQVLKVAEKAAHTAEEGHSKVTGLINQTPVSLKRNSIPSNP
jgi:hypothetical protein